MSKPRESICASASQKLAAAIPSLAGKKAVIGLDGFVDEIIAVVDKRHSHEAYDAIPTIELLGQKVSAAAGKSMNFELMVKRMKLGGNGPIMANALAAAGVGVTYVGAVGFPTIHSVFSEMAEHANVISLGEPGHTDALEFEDGKLMLGKYTKEMGDINWDNLMSRVGQDRWVELLEQADLVGMVNWVMLPFLGEIWEKSLALGVPNRTGKKRSLFIDLCDPEKRTHADILHAMNTLTKYQGIVDVTLGLNLKEASTIAEVIGVPVKGDAEMQIVQTAQRIREKLNLHCVVVHPRRGAAAATAGEHGTFAGPFIKEPKISTGAGDHFNGGFCLGRMLGLDLEESLCVGTATSGYYVRTGVSPTATQLAEFIGELPSPE
ncbi:PfkB family carbohydrate kinase [Humisphaera borealis]|uniref:Carbohydrate kinase family protein n=1 Tax=Humisphaera borealis TaxID=2807512 RepID=A0A7M2X279_9BACT|nr:PfkB family carbohydrate kinase [Humisphaera borealis]QOV90860.1 carbohydrate kinase family protein [Humisphaera borealis]